MTISVLDQLYDMREECAKCKTERDELLAALDAVVSAYDRYRGRGVSPAPNEYAQLAKSIDIFARAVLAKHKERS